MTVDEVSGNRASEAVGCERAKRAAQDRLASHLSKAATSASIHVTGWEPLN